MGVRERIRALFAFSTLPVTFLAVAVYAAVFISVAVLDELPAVPNANQQLGLDIDRAYDDLHKVCKLTFRPGINNYIDTLPADSWPSSPLQLSPKRYCA